MIVGALSPDEMTSYWHLLEGHFKVFCDLSHGADTVDGVLEDCIAGRRQCWAAVDSKIHAVLVTAVRDRRLWIEFCSGKDREKWQGEVLSHLEKWARDQDMISVVGAFRKGWRSLTDDRGYRQTHYVAEKVLQ